MRKFFFQKRKRVKRSRKGEVCQLILKVLVAPIVGGRGGTPPAPSHAGIPSNSDGFANISPYMMRPLVIHDFATAPF